jgi:hypothetical protein
VVSQVSKKVEAIANVSWTPRYARETQPRPPRFPTDRALMFCDRECQAVWRYAAYNFSDDQGKGKGLEVAGEVRIQLTYPYNN